MGPTISDLSKNEKSKEEVAEDIKNICVNYMKFMIECAENPELKEKCLSEKATENEKEEVREKLNKEVKMKIPPGIPIYFDDEVQAKPAIWIARAKSRISLTEGRLEIRVIGNDVNGTGLEAKLKIKEEDRREFNIELGTLEKDLEKFWNEYKKDPKKADKKLGKFLEKKVQAGEVGFTEYTYEEFNSGRIKALTNKQLKFIKKAYADRKEKGQKFLVVVKLPFFNIQTDILGKYKFNENSDESIILTTA